MTLRGKLRFDRGTILTVSLVVVVRVLSRYHAPLEGPVAGLPLEGRHREVYG